MSCPPTLTTAPNRWNCGKFSIYLEIRRCRAVPIIHAMESSRHMPEREFRWIVLLALAIGLFAAGRASAQTGYELMVKPWLGNSSYELDNASALVQQRGHEEDEDS